VSGVKKESRIADFSFPKRIASVEPLCKQYEKNPISLVNIPGRRRKGKKRGRRNIKRKDRRVARCRGKKTLESRGGRKEKRKAEAPTK